MRALKASDFFVRATLAGRWFKQRRSSPHGTNPNADDLSEYIKKRWPEMSSDEADRVFNMIEI